LGGEGKERGERARGSICLEGKGARKWEEGMGIEQDGWKGKLMGSSEWKGREKNGTTVCNY